MTGSHCPGRERRWIIPAAILLLACLLPSSCASPQLSPSLRKKIDDNVKLVMDKLDIPGALVGVAIPGKGEYLVAVGKADVATGRAMSLRDRFKVGSMTKTFTANAVLQLVVLKLRLARVSCLPMGTRTEVHR